MTKRRFWAVIPAAGSGARMQAPVPKQYLMLAGKKLIEHVLEKIGNHSRISGVVVAISAQDQWWQEVSLNSRAPVMRVTGGSERCHSVLAGLARLRDVARSEDWVLVHDAARPCLPQQDLDRLLAELSDHPVGGLLALPVRDTIKRDDGQRTVTATVEREGLWHALTPQMFRYDALREALEAVIATDRIVTDEAQAMELAGAKPRLVEGSAENIKITCPQDLALAEFYLRLRQEMQECA
ncbi:MAG: 2-C-methyl-D-erythritol 4-phosphate cytidylyltransferase [Gammaproteobacteria bacterium]